MPTNIVIEGITGTMIRFIKPIDGVWADGIQWFSRDGGLTWWHPSLKRWRPFKKEWVDKEGVLRQRVKRRFCSRPIGLDQINRWLKLIGLALVVGYDEAKKRRSEAHTSGWNVRNTSIRM